MENTKLNIDDIKSLIYYGKSDKINIDDYPKNLDMALNFMFNQVHPDVRKHIEEVFWNRVMLLSNLKDIEINSTSFNKVKIPNEFMAEETENLILFLLDGIIDFIKSMRRKGYFGEHFPNNPVYIEQDEVKQKLSDVKEWLSEKFENYDKIWTDIEERKKVRKSISFEKYFLDILSNKIAYLKKQYT